MKKLLFFLWTFILTTGISAQNWQQETDYLIDVSLNDSSKTLDGFEKITYTNNSPDTLYFIWFHLWPNAYKNDMTAFSDQLLENGNTAFYFSDRIQRGYINRLDFRVDGMNAKVEDHPEHIDIIRVLLPKPLLPHEQVVISTPFHVQLPFNFSRGGYDGESFQISQWYPKPAVYDTKGWHEMPYLDQGEFFSEFGNYDVRITVPENYVVAATGKLSTPEEMESLKRKAAHQQNSQDNKNDNPADVKKATVKKTASPPKKKFDLNAYPPSSDRLKTIRYVQENVHDFAWFADKRFLIAIDTCILASGKVVKISSYYTPDERQYWDKSTGYAKSAIRFYSENVGEYPYDVVSIVQGPKSFGGGMEYPTITVIAPIESDEELERTIVHEVGHNWFYGILASNERDNPWMDEGINTFYEQSYMRNRYGIEPGESSLLYQTKIIRKTAQPFTESSEKLSVINYELAAYDATATWMKSLEDQIGKESFQKLMHE
ncbi:MAG: M1 family metallopeptidase, partial [Flavisolibacter sp.]